MVLKEQIMNYKPINYEEEAIKQYILKWMDNFDDVLTRDNNFGHFASTGIVLNQERDKMLLVYHNIYDSWLAPGGHADGEEDLLSVALREVEEETGQKAKILDDSIFAISASPIVGHMKRGKYVPAHTHLDAFYLLEADDTIPLVYREDESKGVKWEPIERILDEDNIVYFMLPVHKRILEKCAEKQYIKKRY